MINTEWLVDWLSVSAVKICVLAVCWRQNGGFRSPEGHGRYGSHSCDSPFILVESAIKAMKNITGHEGIEFILWTGYVLLSLFKCVLCLYPHTDRDRDRK